MSTVLTVDESSNVQNNEGGVTSNDTNAPLPLQFQDALAAEGAGGGPVSNVALSGVDGTVANQSGVNVMTFGAGVIDVGFTDASGDPLDAVNSGLFTTDGTAIYLYTSTFNNNVVVGRAGLGGDVVLAVYLDTGVDNGTGDPGATGAKLWMVQFDTIQHPDGTDPNDIVYLSGLLNVSVNNLSNFSLEGAPSGQNLFLMFGDGTPDPGDVAIVATGWHPANQSTGASVTSGDTVNTGQGGGGTTIGSNNQMIDPNEGMYFTFVKGANANYTVPNLDQNEADVEANIDFTQYEGALSASFALVQLQPPKGATLKISAFNNTDTGEVGASYIDGLGDGDDLAVNITDVSITRMVKVGKNLVETTYSFSESVNNPQGGLTLSFAGDTVTITGAHAGDRITYTTPTEHNRVLINNIGSGSGNPSASFDIGGFQLSSGSIQTNPLDDLAFVDDGPTASIDRTVNSVALDETLGAKAGDANAATDDISGGNPDPFAGAYGTPIGALAGVDLVDTTTSVGVDTFGATTTVVLEIVGGSGSDSGLDTTGGTQIDLWMEADGTVTGRTGGSSGTVIFAIAMASDGTVSVAQYASLQHPTPGASHDESVDLSGKLNAVVTVTDGDTDVATDSVGIGDAIGFQDDGPTVSANTGAQLDDDALTGGNSGGTGDDTDSANTTGTLGHAFGTDGAGSVDWLTTGAPAGFSYEASGSSLLIKQGTTLVMTLTLNTATGDYSVTQNAAILHAAGSDENNQAFTVNYRVTDGDGDTSDGTLGINVDDDTPNGFTPDSLTLMNTGSDSGTEDLNSGGKVGADGLGTLLFVDNYLADDYLRDSNTSSLLTSGGQNIVLSGWGTGTLVAARETGGETVFTATLNSLTNQYDVTFSLPIDDGGGINFLGAAPVKSGNPTYNVINDVDGTTLDLLFSGGDVNGGSPAVHSVNVSTTGAGTDNQSMNAGETLRIDFSVGASLAGSPNGSDFVLGTHQTVNGFSFLVSQNTPSGTTGTAYIKAIDADGDKTLVGDAGDVADTITKVLVNGLTVMENGVVTAQTINGHQVSAIVYNGGVVVTGLNEGATGDGTGGDDPVVKVYTADGFNRVEVSNYAGQVVNGATLGGTSFDIGPAGVDQAVQGTAFAFDLPVQLTDADGDSTPIELIGVDVNPVPI